MATLVLLNKPFQTLSQFRDDRGRPTLADFINIPGVYPAGRLDQDSEGLLLLTGHGPLQHRIASPANKMPKTYWAQVEGCITTAALAQLSEGVELRDGPTRPATAQAMEPPDVWPRQPPVRERASIPTSWLCLVLTEGRNRQVRRMTAAVGFPTLRLIRYRIGDWTLDGLAPGQYRRVSVHLPAAPAPKKPAGARTRTPARGRRTRRQQQ